MKLSGDPLKKIFLWLSLLATLVLIMGTSPGDLFFAFANSSFNAICKVFFFSFFNHK